MMMSRIVWVHVQTINARIIIADLMFELVDGLLVSEYSLGYFARRNVSFKCRSELEALETFRIANAFVFHFNLLFFYFKSKHN